MPNSNYAVPPGHFLQEWLTENEMPLGDAMHVLDIESDVVIDLLNGNTELLASHAKNLAELTGIPADSWLRYEAQYRADTDRLAKQTDSVPVLDQLSDAITHLAGQRTKIKPAHLLMETAINIVVLTRITTQQLDADQRDAIDRAAEDLAAAMRRLAREIQS